MTEKDQPDKNQSHRPDPPEGPPDPMAQRAAPPVPDWAEQPDPLHAPITAKFTTRVNPDTGELEMVPAPTVRGKSFDIGDHAEGTNLDREADDG